MISTISFLEAREIADLLVGWSLEIRQGEKTLILTDPRVDPVLVDALWSAAQAASGNALRLELPYQPAIPHGYLVWQEPDERVARLMAESQVVIGCTTNLFCLSEAVASARLAGTRFMWLPGTYDFGRPLVHKEDWRRIGDFGEAICRHLVGDCDVRITNPRGTDLLAHLSAQRTPFWDDVRAIHPGDLDFFPGGMWNTVPDPESVNGRVIFEGSLHPVGILTEPVVVEYHNGRIVSIQGGRQARAWENWLKAYQDEGVFDFSHLSGGLAQHATVYGHDWEDLIIRGSVLISGGENVLYGGSNTSKGHFDGVVLDSTMVINGKTILKDGDYLLS